LKAWEEALGSQLSEIVPVKRLEELPAVVYRLVEETKSSKALSELAQAKAARYEAQVEALTTENDNYEAKIIALQEELRSRESQLKRKAISDSRFYGVDSIDNLPVRFTELTQALQEAEEKLAALTARGQKQKASLLQAKTTVSQLSHANAELESANAGLQLQVGRLAEERGTLSRTVQSLEQELLQVGDRLQMVEARQGDTLEKALLFDKMSGALESVVDFDSPESIVDVVVGLKNESEKFCQAVQKSEEQVNELIGLLKDFTVRKKVKIPISDVVMRRLREHLSELVAAGEQARALNGRVVNQAARYGYSGADAGAALEFLDGRVRQTVKGDARRG
jgi:chromosome segregation ATPase